MLLEFRDVSFTYDTRQKVLDGVSFSISEGEKVALLGLNGAGKSTLLLHTNGLLKPTEGRVLINGKDTGSKKNLREIRKEVGLVFQNPDDQLFMPTVWDDVAFGPQNMGLSREEVASRVEDALRATGTMALSGRSPMELSGGQKKSVSIATVLSMRPTLLVMDEPTSGLDREAVMQFEEIVKSLDQAFLISTHDEALARRLCSRVIYLEAGRVGYEGDWVKTLLP